jgi:MPBQ/MSBQ methyltransferase
MAMPSSTNFKFDEETEILQYLTGLYQNVFTEDAIQAHLVNHVGYPAAEYGVAVVASVLPPPARILDVGAGFGSFVLLARQAGFDASGVEIAQFEVEFARRRLARLRPQDDPAATFYRGDAYRIAAPDAAFDAITYWNVFEHVVDAEPLVAFASRKLKPGGYAFIVCPNYAAERDEAHYHVPWMPELRHDRIKAAAYIRGFGRDPGFFESSIFCRTNKEVLGLLRKYRFELFDIDGLRPMALSLANLSNLIRYWRQVKAFYSATRHSVLVAARRA